MVEVGGLDMDPLGDIPFQCMRSALETPHLAAWKTLISIEVTPLFLLFLMEPWVIIA